MDARHGRRVPDEELAQFASGQLEGDHRVVERIERREVGAGDLSLDERRPHAAHVLERDVGLECLAHRVGHEVVRREVIAAVGEIVGRLADHFSVPAGDRLPVPLDHGGHRLVLGDVGGNRDEPRAITVHVPGAARVLDEEQIEPAELARPLVRLHDHRPVHVVRLQIFGLPDERARRQPRMGVAAHDDIDAGHRRRQLLVHLFTRVRDEDDDVRLAAERRNECARGFDLVGNLHAFLGCAVAGGLAGDQAEDSDAKRAHGADRVRLDQRLPGFRLDGVRAQDRVAGEGQDALGVGQAVAELVVPDRREGVAGGVHGLDVRLPVVFERERGAVGEVSRVDEPDGGVLRLEFLADPLDQRSAPRDAADVRPRGEPLQAGARRHDSGVAERQQVTVRVVRVEDRQRDRAGPAGGDEQGQPEQVGEGQERSSLHAASSAEQSSAGGGSLHTKTVNPQCSSR